MADVSDAFKSAFRDFNTDGVAASGVYKPEKSQIRAIGPVIESEFDRVDGRIDDTSQELGDRIEEVAVAAEGITVKATWSDLSATTGTRDGQAGRVIGDDTGTHTDPVTGETVDNVGEYSWSEGDGAWQWLTDVVTFDPVTESDGASDAGKVPVLGATGEVDASMVGSLLPTIDDTTLVQHGAEAWLLDAAGNALPIGAQEVVMEFGAADEQFVYRVDTAGNHAPIADGAASNSVAATVITSGSNYWSDSDISLAKAEAAAEVARRAAQDLSNFPEYIAGYNGVALEGQSYMQEDGTSGLFYTLARATRMGWTSPGLCVGGDARPHADGATYLPYGTAASTSSPTKYKYEPDSGGASERSLNLIYENFVGGSNNDQIFTDAEAAIGNVPSNARSGDRSGVFAFVFGWLCREYFQQETLPSDRNLIVMNKSKGGALLADILGPQSDGLARFLHMHTVFNEAIAAGSHSGWDKQWMATIMDHGQADEVAGTETYADDLLAAMDTTWDDLGTKTGQTRRPPWLMSQVGSDRGTVTMACARAQLAMSKDLTGTGAYAFLHRSTTENPTLKDAAMEVETNNSHPILSGKVLAGIRDAIAAFKICVMRQPYYIPYVTKYVRKGDRGLAILASMTGDLKVSPLPYGCTPKLLSHLGFMDRDATGGDDDVPIDARIVPGTSLVEFKFSGSKSGVRQLCAGPNNGTSHFGQIYVRDSFDIEQPITIAFNETMRRWHNPLYGEAGDTGEGYLETPGAAGLTRGGYVNQVAGIVDCKIELGNPVARDIVESTDLE